MMSIENQARAIIARNNGEMAVCNGEEIRCARALLQMPINIMFLPHCMRSTFSVRGEPSMRAPVPENNVSFC